MGPQVGDAESTVVFRLQVTVPSVCMCAYHPARSLARAPVRRCTHRAARCPAQAPGCRARCIKEDATEANSHRRKGASCRTGSKTEPSSSVIRIVADPGVGSGGRSDERLRKKAASCAGDTASPRAAGLASKRSAGFQIRAAAWAIARGRARGADAYGWLRRAGPHFGAPLGGGAFGESGRFQNEKGTPAVAAEGCGIALLQN